MNVFFTQALDDNTMQLKTAAPKKIAGNWCLKAVCTCNKKPHELYTKFVT
jgi:hypothetical protein